ncbi:autotransporter outer membrane beta-barrel domain-containing protein [Devosia sp. ZW T5_3]|uniref:autotransporter outer membrane beta-barrel domain-containing protein n=1 Tax=Devosia sp. ZW T5_3 TaxID=3378085 RepID=UPI003853ED6E
MADSQNVDVHVNELTGGRSAVGIAHYGTGSASFTADGLIRTAETGSAAGVNVQILGDGSDIFVKTAAVDHGSNGAAIALNNDGYGATSLEASGTVSGAWGITAAAGARTTGGISIDVVDVVGTFSGIYATNSGSGGVGITATGSVEGGATDGIYVWSDVGSGALAIDAAAVSADRDAIAADYYGSGKVDITSTGLVEGGVNGIRLNTYGTSQGISIDSADITGGTNGIWIDHRGEGAVDIKAHDVEGTGNDAINIDTLATSTGLSIDVNDVTAGASGIHFVHRGSGETTVVANDVTSVSHGIWFDTYGSGDVSVTAHDIESTAGLGIWLDTYSTTKDLDIEVNSITSGDDGINAIHSGDGTVNITALGSIVSGDDAMELYFDNGDVKQVNIDVNNAKGADFGIYVVDHSDAIDPADPAAVNNDLNITTRGNIEAGSGWGIWTDTDPGVLTNITVKSTSVIDAASGYAIFNADGNSHVIIENAKEIVDDPSTVEIEKSSVNGVVRLGAGADQLDLHGGFSGITEANGGYGGTNSDDVLNLRDANSTYDARNIIGWDVFNISNSYLTLDGPLGNLDVGTAGVAGTGIFLTGGSTLESNQRGLNIFGNLTLDAGTTFLSDVNDDAGNPGRGDTYVTGFLTNAGTVSIADGAADDDFAVNGLYTGNNGTLVLDTVLGNDTSRTDTMTFRGGTAEGTTSVVVNNVGGTGAPTVEGIKIVDVSGTSNGVFSLVGDYQIDGQQAVIGGAYGYTLWKNGVGTPTDGDWYLRSQLKPVDPVDPTNPTNPTNPTGPIYQPGVPVYEAYSQVMLGMNGLPTLQQRVGNRYWTEGQAAADAVGAPAIDENGVWGVVEASHAQFRPDESTSGAEYDLDIWRLRAGVDGLILQTDDGKLIAGLTGHYGQGSSSISSVFGPGSISTDAYGVGATATWYANSGFYLDGQAQVSWFNSDLSSDWVGSLTSDNGGLGYALSIEAGQRVNVSENWTVIPQAQLVYSNVRFDGFTDPFGAQVGGGSADTLVGRFGLAVEYSNSWTSEAGQSQRAAVYGIANLHYDFLDGASTNVSGTEVGSQNDPLRGEIGLGGSYNWNDDKFSLYGEISASSSLNNFGDSYSLGGKVGFRAKW